MIKYAKDKGIKEVSSLTNNLALTPELFEGAKGIKTGLTELAGENLITLVDRNRHQIIIGLFGSQDRFGETKKVIEWIFSNHNWEFPPLTH